MVVVPQMALDHMGLYLHGALHWVDRQSDIPMGACRGIIVEFEQLMPLLY